MPEGSLQAGQRGLVHTQRSGERELFQGHNCTGVAQDDAGLRSAQEFVAATRHQSGTGHHTLLDGGLVGQSIEAGVQQRAATQIIEQEQHPLTG